MRRSRRGQVEIPFHLIFAAVGGILFLLFFFILIKSILHAGEKQQGRDLVSGVETVILTASASPNTFTVTNVQEATYEFRCERDQLSFDSYLRVDTFSESSDKEVFRHVALFSPRVVKGDQLFTSTQTWNAPFPVARFLLLSNNRTRYIFVAGSQQGLKGLKSFVEEKNLESFGIDHVMKGALSTYREQDFDQYRFVFFDATPTESDLVSLKEKFEKVGVLVVQRSGIDDQAGSLTFYDWTGCAAKACSPTATTKQYYGDAMLLAAIFSEDATIFSCNMAKAYERLNTTLAILDGRIGRLLSQDGIAMNDECVPYLQNGRELLQNYGAHPDAFFANPTMLKELKTVNTQLVTRVCPQVY